MTYQQMISSVVNVVQNLIINWRMDQRRKDYTRIIRIINERNYKKYEENWKR